MAADELPRWHLPTIEALDHSATLGMAGRRGFVPRARIMYLGENTKYQSIGHSADWVNQRFLGYCVISYSSHLPDEVI